MTERPHCVVTTESEGWILRKIASVFAERTTRLESSLSPALEPIRTRPDCIFYSSWYHYWRQPPAIRRIPFVALVTHLDRTALRVVRMAMHSHGRIACMSNHYRRLLRRHGIPNRKLMLAPVGVDLNQFHPLNDNAPHGKIRIGVIGRVYADGRKGEQRLREIMRALNPDVYELHIIGDLWDTQLPQLRAGGMAVHYHQRVPDEKLPHIIRELDILLITSRREGGPIPALEALACGVPLVSRPVGYVPDLLATLPAAGHLFHTSAEAVAILRDARRHKAALSQQRDACRAMLRSYTWDAFVRTIEDALAQLLSDDNQQ